MMRAPTAIMDMLGVSFVVTISSDEAVFESIAAAAGQRQYIRPRDTFINNDESTHSYHEQFKVRFVVALSSDEAVLESVAATAGQRQYIRPRDTFMNNDESSEHPQQTWTG